MKYFKNCYTIEDVKKVFKELAKKYHPDCGGDADKFKEMMSEYKIAFNLYKNTHYTAEGATYAKEEETTETPQDFADIINKVIFMEGVKIEIIGSWVWLSGNTMIYKELIKAAGFWWSRSKKAWYYNGSNEYHKRRGYYNLDGVRAKWGAKVVQSRATEKLA